MGGGGGGRGGASGSVRCVPVPPLRGVRPSLANIDAGVPAIRVCSLHSPRQVYGRIRAPPPKARERLADATFNRGHALQHDLEMEKGNVRISRVSGLSPPASPCPGAPRPILRAATEDLGATSRRSRARADVQRSGNFSSAPAGSRQPHVPFVVEADSGCVPNRIAKYCPGCRRGRRHPSGTSWNDEETLERGAKNALRSSASLWAPVTNSGEGPDAVRLRVERDATIMEALCPRGKNATDRRARSARNRGLRPVGRRPFSASASSPNRAAV